MKSEKSLRVFGVLLVLALGVFSMYLVLAATLDVPTGITFNQNVTPIYDEGSFFVNWTAPAGNNIINYTVYVHVNGNLINTTINDSATGFHYTNSTEANYTFRIAAVNASTTVTVRYNESSNSTNISMFVDTTVPTSLIHTINATAKKNTEKLTLNISVSDATSGLTGAACVIDVNGTNQTLPLSSGWCNSTSVDLTNLADGNKIIRIWVNDTVNNIGNNYTRYVQVDTTSPVATVSCSPTSVQTGATFPCTCSGSDATSGVSTSSGTTTSPDGTVIPSSTGNFKYTCTVSDKAGNSATATATYNVESPPSSGSGGGGSGSGGTTESTVKASNIFTKLTPGFTAIMKDIDKEIGVKEVQIDVRNEVRSVRIDIVKYDGKPAAVSVEKSGDVYRYLQIETENLPESDLNKGTLIVQVERSWVSDNGLERDSIVISKFDEITGEWNELDTFDNGADDTYYFYRTELNSFSFFTIGSKFVEEEEEEKTTAEEITERVKMNLTWILIVLGSVAAGIIIYVTLFLNKKKRKKLGY